MKWKFFFNGTSWWMRITDVHQLEEYFSKTDEHRFGGAMMTVAHRNMDEPYKSRNIFDKYCEDEPIELALDLLHHNSGIDLLTTTAQFRFDAHKTYFKNLLENGFVNINKCGGCNSCNWPMYAVIEKDEPIFPVFTRKDVEIKTWAPVENAYGQYRTGYNYHYYAYIGGVRLTDGDKEKWDTRKECEEFIDKLFA